MSHVRVKCIVLGAAGAGKTSILRRYFSDTFHRERVPTLGADFYTGKVKYPHVRQDGEEKKELDDNVAPYVSLQIWDTAGRERFVAGRKAKYTAALSDAFFRHVDAAVLVYDATSSTSFTQLLKWHADLMERMNRIEKKLPVLIVANKIDLFQSENSEPRRRRSIAPQRDVLGLGGQFRGKDCPYEYRASAPAAHENTKSKKSHRVVFSTYRDTGDTWTTDGWYLDSVLNTEDGSHPDRDMVLLWCMRNGLKHVEVSALDGTYMRVACLLEDVTVSLTPLSPRNWNRYSYGVPSQLGNGICERAKIRKARRGSLQVSQQQTTGSASTIRDKRRRM